jgi:hypothetical protein
MQATFAPDVAHVTALNATIKAAQRFNLTGLTLKGNIYTHLSLTDYDSCCIIMFQANNRCLTIILPPYSAKARLFRFLCVHFSAEVSPPDVRASA